MKAFIESQFGYSPLLWMFHSRTLDKRINRLHKRALRLHPSLTEMYKIRNNMAPEIVKYIFPDTTNPYNLLNKNLFQSSNVHTVYHGTETSFGGHKTCALVPKEIKASKSITE